MTALDTSITGTSGGISNDEEAATKLIAAVAKLDFDPVVLCGANAFSMWLEILCGTSLGLGVSSEGRGKQEFMIAAESCGKMGFKISRETINTRSAMAWQVQEQHVLLARNTGLDKDFVAIYDRRRFTK